MEGPFVKFSFPCECGVDLEIHGRPFRGGRGDSSYTIKCPKCNSEHELSTKAIRVLYRDGNLWYVVPNKSRR
jgi:hypothetical protein